MVSSAVILTSAHEKVDPAVRGPPAESRGAGYADLASPASCGRNQVTIVWCRSFAFDSIRCGIDLPGANEPNEGHDDRPYDDNRQHLDIRPARSRDGQSGRHRSAAHREGCPDRSRLVVHYLQMLLAMGAGMLVLGPAVDAGRPLGRRGTGAANG
jgi:hypothetical protein